MTAYPKQTYRHPKQPAHVPKNVLAALIARDEHRSAWTGDDVPTLVPQHRHGGAGGRRGKHRLSNLVWLESSLNSLIESDAAYQAEAILRGIKISLHADPTLIPVRHAVHGIVFLRDEGDPVPVGQVDGWPTP